MNSKFISIALKVATVALVSAAVNEALIAAARRKREKVVTEVQ